MNTETVLALFTLFSGVSNPEDYSDIISISVDEVTKSLRTGADLTDKRLCCLSASLATKLTAEILSSREKTVLSSNGSVSLSENYSQRIKNANELFLQMKALCADLITDSEFVFSVTGKN